MVRRYILKRHRRLWLLLSILALLLSGVVIYSAFNGKTKEESDSNHIHHQLERIYRSDFVYTGYEKSPGGEPSETAYFFTPSVRPDITVTAYYYEGPHKGPMQVVPFGGHDTIVTDDFWVQIKKEIVKETIGEKLDLTAMSTDEAVELIEYVGTEISSAESKYVSSNAYVDTRYTVCIDNGKTEVEESFLPGDKWHHTNVQVINNLKYDNQTYNQ